MLQEKAEKKLQNKMDTAASGVRKREGYQGRYVNTTSQRTPGNNSGATTPVNGRDSRMRSTVNKDMVNEWIAEKLKGYCKQKEVKHLFDIDEKLQHATANLQVIKYKLEL
jgi:hypothetical protein